MDDTIDDSIDNFCFVAVTRPGSGWKSGGEHLIRAHAARHSRRKQKLQRMKSQSDQPRTPVDLALASDQALFNKRYEEYWVWHFSLHAIDSHFSNQARALEDLKGCYPKELENVDSSIHCYDYFIDLQRGQPSDYRLSMCDDRLLAHISQFYSPLGANRSLKFVLWTKGVKQ